VRYVARYDTETYGILDETTVEQGIGSITGGLVGLVFLVLTLPILPLHSTELSCRPAQVLRNK
jgi:hypothetical protein